MKSKLIYVLSFVMAFVIVTAAIVYLNSTYQNIFEFDFSPRSVQADSLKQKMPIHVKGLDSQSMDSLMIAQADSLKPLFPIESEMISVLKDSIEVLHKLLASTIQNHKGITAALDNQQDFGGQKDSSYILWLKKTTDLYNAMDAKKAAKIIQNYSDNVARDILYGMKNKNAAAVVAELTPETANRIIRLR